MVPSPTTGRHLMMQQKHHNHWIQRIQITPLDINILNHLH